VYNSSSPVVFCHNDLQEGIVVTDQRHSHLQATFYCPHRTAWEIFVSAPTVLTTRRSSFSRQHKRTRAVWCALISSMRRTISGAALFDEPVMVAYFVPLQRVRLCESLLRMDTRLLLQRPAVFQVFARKISNRRRATGIL
jgi:hypothetical protein